MAMALEGMVAHASEDMEGAVDNQLIFVNWIYSLVVDYFNE